MKYYLITYKNWKDEVADRCILPVSIKFGSNEYHKIPTWLITAHDVDVKNDNGVVSLNISNKLKTFDVKNILEVKETKELNFNQVEKYVFDNSMLSKFTEDQDKIDFLTGTLELEINESLKEKTILRKTLDKISKWNFEDQAEIENLRARLEDMNRYDEEKTSEINNLYSTIKNLDELVKNLVDKIYSLEYHSAELTQCQNNEISNFIKKVSSLYKQKADDSYHISKLMEKESKYIQKENNSIDLMDLSKKRNSLLNEFNDILVNGHLNEKFLGELGILNSKEVAEAIGAFVRHDPKFEIKDGVVKKTIGEVVETFEVPRVRAYPQAIRSNLLFNNLNLTEEDRSKIINDLDY